MFLHALEIVGRVTAIYVALLVLLRIAGKKELAQLAPMELVTLLLLSETVSPALTGGSDRLDTGLIAGTTLIALTLLVSRLTFRSRALERLVDGTATVLIDGGKVNENVLRRHRLTDDQLRTALHEQGLLSVNQVKRAFIEPDGHITFIKKDQSSSE
jgi:uncharacterized membrane protein YcaP (DUF421 family)